MKYGNTMLLILAGVAGLIVGYYRHLLVLSTKHRFPDQILINRAKIATIFLILDIVLIIVVARKNRKLNTKQKD
jgi:hypothetical protein